MLLFVRDWYILIDIHFSIFNKVTKYYVTRKKNNVPFIFLITIILHVRSQGYRKFPILIYTGVMYM